MRHFQNTNNLDNRPDVGMDPVRGSPDTGLAKPEFRRFFKHRWLDSHFYTRRSHRGDFDNDGRPDLLIAVYSSYSGDHRHPALAQHRQRVCPGRCAVPWRRFLIGRLG